MGYRTRLYHTFNVSGVTPGEGSEAVLTLPAALELLSADVVDTGPRG